VGAKIKTAIKANVTMGADSKIPSIVATKAQKKIVGGALAIR